MIEASRELRLKHLGMGLERSLETLNMRSGG